MSKGNKGSDSATRHHYTYATTGRVPGLKEGGTVKSSGHGERGVPKREPSIQRYGNGFRKVKP